MNAELFDLAKGSTDGDEYKNKIRSLTSNFRQNQQLRVATLTEQLPAKRVCLMTAIELASDEKRREIQALYKEIVADSMEAKGGDAVTDMVTASSTFYLFIYFMFAFDSSNAASAKSEKQRTDRRRLARQTNR